MCFSVTSGSACFRRGSQPGHIKQSGCVGGRGRAGTTRLFCFGSRLLPTLRAPRGSHAQAGGLQERASFVSCGLTRTPRLHEGHLRATGVAPPKKPSLQNHSQTPESRRHKGKRWWWWWRWGCGRAPVLLMHFCVVCTAVN